MSPQNQKVAQLVVDGIYLGPLQVARNAEALTAQGVTKVLSILGPDQEFESVAVNPKDRVWVQVTDRVESEQQMREALPVAVEQLVRWRNSGETVLIHCQSGISRSATIVIAFVIKAYRLPLMEAYKLVYEKRNAINPNDGFFRVLQEFSATELSLPQSKDDEAVRIRSEEETSEYYAFQLVSQLAFAGVTLDQARAALADSHGRIEVAASKLLLDSGM